MKPPPLPPLLLLLLSVLTNLPGDAMAEPKMRRRLVRKVAVTKRARPDSDATADILVLDSSGVASSYFGGGVSPADTYHAPLAPPIVWQGELHGFKPFTQKPDKECAYCRSSISELKDLIYAAFDNIDRIGEENIKLKEELEVAKSQNLRLHTRLRRVEKDLKKAKKDGFDGVGMVTTTTRPSGSGNGELSRRVENIAMRLTLAERGLSDAESSRMSDYRALMSRINRAEERAGERSDDLDSAVARLAAEVGDARDQIEECCARVVVNGNGRTTTSPTTTTSTTTTTTTSTTTTTTRTRVPPPPTFNSGRLASVSFCGFNPDRQGAANATLVYKEASVQTQEWLRPEAGTFVVPMDGNYLLMFSLSTRTCGSFELCSPTTVDLVRDGTSLRSYRTGAGTRRRNDFEALSASTIVSGLTGDSFRLVLAATALDGVYDLEFCGILLP